MPKEGILNWLCGLSITNIGTGDDDLVHEYLDAWISPEAGKFLLDDYGYGHSNRLTFEIADPKKVADLGFPSDPIEMLNDGIMFQPYDPFVLENMVNPTFPIYHPNSWKSYHFPTAKELYPLCSHPMA